jgi:hypothetical protein
MAANTFAMEAMTLYTASLVDRDKKSDIRLEAAMCKMWGSELSWEIVNDTMQIRGGRGYETADSLKARGDEPVPVERLFRDSRINAIFEGSSEIMRLFIAREALEPHLKVAAPLLNSQLPLAQRMKAALKAVWFYARWYPKQCLPRFQVSNSNSQVAPVLRRHLRYTGRSSIASRFCWAVLWTSAQSCLPSRRPARERRLCSLRATNHENARRSNSSIISVAQLGCASQGTLPVSVTMLTGKATDWRRKCWPASTIGWRKGPLAGWIERGEVKRVQPAGASRHKIPENFCGAFNPLCYIHALSNGLDLAIQARRREVRVIAPLQ